MSNSCFPSYLSELSSIEKNFSADSAAYPAFLGIRGPIGPFRHFRVVENDCKTRKKIALGRSHDLAANLIAQTRQQVFLRDLLKQSHPLQRLQAGQACPPSKSTSLRPNGI